jgi:uncharacterized membrane protein
LWHVDCAHRLAKGEIRVEPTSTTAAAKPSIASKLDWPILTFWLTYLSIVFGILYAVITESI